MSKIIAFVKKNWFYILFVLIILGALALRTYNFNEWLYFKSDQVRDAKLAKTAFENGIGELPLLGPRAAGTFLRLGPIFYYQEYFSAKIFDSVEPHVFVFPDLLFSILTIPLFFLFLKIFFPKRISFLITILYSFSFIIIQYSRFAWNPNQIPFWAILFLLSLLKIYSETDKKKAGWWLLLLGFSYGVVSQLHFVALIGFPIIAFIFWIFYFPRKINWKYWLGSLAVFLFLYIPFIVSDFYTQGDNLNQFIYAITAKTGEQALSLFESFKIIAISLFMFLTSFGHKEGIVSALAGFILVIGGIGTLLYFWKKNKEASPFVYLVLIWFFVFVFLQINTDISLKPRFFMPIAFLPFIFWGSILKFIESFHFKFLTAVAYFSFVVILLMNFNGIKIWFSFLENQDMGEINRNIFIKQDDAKTLGQIKKAANFMAEKGREADKTVCFYSGPDYERSYEYVFDVYFSDVKYDRISKSIKNKEDCIYFSIATARDEAKLISNRYVDYFDFGNVYEFGRIAVWELEARDNFINYDKEKEDEIKQNEEKNEPKTEIIENEDDLTEEEIEELILNELEDLSEKDENENNGEEKVKPPRRMERVFWKHVFKEEYEN